MTPTFKITVNDEDYTKTLMDRLLELRLVEMDGYKSDYLEIRLDDREYIKHPTHGAIIKASIGYQGQPIVYKGEYTHDETEFEGPLKQMTVRAAAVNFRDGLNGQRSRSFDNFTLGELVTAIANDNGYKAYIDEFLTNITIPYLAQTNESDLRLLTRLSTQYGATFKASSGALVFFMRGGKKDEDLREALGSVTLKPEDISTWYINRQDKNLVTAVTAKWYDYDSAVLKTVKVGEGNTTRDLRSPFANEETAILAAQAKLDRLLRSTVTASITLPGNPYLIAEGGLILEGFRDGVDEEYTINRVEHILTKKGGYKCKVKAELQI